LVAAEVVGLERQAQLEQVVQEALAAMA